MKHWKISLLVLFLSAKPPTDLRSCLEWLFGVQMVFMAVGGTRELFFAYQTNRVLFCCNFPRLMMARSPLRQLGGADPRHPAAAPAAPRRRHSLQPEEPQPPGRGRPRCPPDANAARQQEVPGLRASRGRAPPAQRQPRSGPAAGARDSPLRAPRFARCRSTCAPGKVSK